MLIVEVLNFWKAYSTHSVPKQRENVRQHQLAMVTNNVTCVRDSSPRHRCGQVVLVCPTAWQMPQDRDFLAAGGLLEAPLPLPLPLPLPSPLGNPPPKTPDAVEAERKLSGVVDLLIAPMCTCTELLRMHENAGSTEVSNTLKVGCHGTRLNR